MSTTMTLQRIWADRDNGRLRDICHHTGVDLLVLLGHSLHGRAEGIEFAYSSEDASASAEVGRQLGERYGHDVLVHALDRMHPRRRRQTLAGSALLVGQPGGKFTEMLSAPRA